MSDEHLDQPERRTFMKGIAAAGGAAALAGFSDGAAAGDDEGTGKNQSEAKVSGYRLTSHVRDYYKSLRI